MAKVSFSKLGLKLKDDIQTIEINGCSIEVKQYLPIEEKFGLISRVLSESQDENHFINNLKISILLKLEIIYAYTNLSFTEKQKENPSKLFDLLESNDQISTIMNAIPQRELKLLDTYTFDIAMSYNTFKNSFLGMLDTMSTDYKAMNEEADSLEKKISDPKTFELLKQVIDKLS